LNSMTTEPQSELQKRIKKIDSEVRHLIDEIKQETSERWKTAVQEEGYRSTERIFAKLQILSACCVAFSHGANDVANAIGPLAAVFDIISSKSVSMEPAIPTWLLAFGGIGIAIGLATWGYKVIYTIGEKITELTPTRGFSAEFGAAVTILLACRLGLPISTTHTLVGAVLGVGFARGVRSLNLRIVRDIIASWVITIPACAAVAIVLAYLISFIMGYF